MKQNEINAGETSHAKKVNNNFHVEVHSSKANFVFSKWRSTRRASAIETFDVNINESQRALMRPNWFEMERRCARALIKKGCWCASALFLFLSCRLTPGADLTRSQFSLSARLLPHAHIQNICGLGVEFDMWCWAFFRVTTALALLAIREREVKWSVINRLPFVLWTRAAAIVWKSRTQIEIMEIYYVLIWV